MAVTLGAGALAGFDRPIDLLMDCHRRIERFLEILLRVAERAAAAAAAAAAEAPPLDDEHRVALETALQYFRAAAPRHTDDEENSLFPLLRQSDDPAACEAMRQVDRLEDEHRQADALHAQVEQLAGRLRADGRLRGDEGRRLVEMLGELRELYRHHIGAEDQIVFPLARRALSDEQLRQVGSEMAARRVADPGRPESRCAQRRRAGGAGSA